MSEASSRASMEDSAVEEKDAAGSVRVAKLKALIQEMKETELQQSLHLIYDKLRKDPVLELPGEVCGQIFELLSPEDLCKCELVCKRWRAVIHENSVWSHLFQRTLRQRQDWHMLRQKFDFPWPTTSLAWKRSFQAFTQSLTHVHENWKHGTCEKRSVDCAADGIYTLQYDDRFIYTGNRDNTIKVWDLESLELQRSIPGHQGSVLCLQYDDNKVITSSSDNTIRVWDRHDDFKCVAVYTHHDESVLHVRFDDEYMVSCSKDRTVVIWHRKAGKEFQYQVAHVLTRHRAAVNVVEFDKQHVVSASGDRTIIIWNTRTGEHLRTLTGHTRGIACIQFHGKHIVSGSSDQTIKLWEVETGDCVGTFAGHTALVRCVRFDSNYIVSGSYDGSVRLWDIKTKECLAVLQGHHNRVFRVQFDAFKIVSSSQDDTLRVWDFAPNVSDVLSERLTHLLQQPSTL